MAMKIEVKQSPNILLVTLNGFVTNDAAAKVFAEYQQIVGRVNPSQYSLLIDCTDMGVFQTDAVETLIKLYKLYMATGFKHIVFIRSKNAIQNMQLDKAAKAVPGFTGQFVAGMPEALTICR